MFIHVFTLGLLLENCTQNTRPLATSWRLSEQHAIQSRQCVYSIKSVYLKKKTRQFWQITTTTTTIAIVFCRSYNLLEGENVGSKQSAATVGRTCVLYYSRVSILKWKQARGLLLLTARSVHVSTSVYTVLKTTDRNITVHVCFLDCRRRCARI